MCDLAYVLWRDQHERVALSVADRYEDPFAYVASALDGFDAWLTADPEQSDEALIDRRIAELLEEVA